LTFVLDIYSGTFLLGKELVILLHFIQSINQSFADANDSIVSKLSPKHS